MDAYRLKQAYASIRPGDLHDFYDLNYVDLELLPKEAFQFHLRDCISWDRPLLYEYEQGCNPALSSTTCAALSPRRLRHLAGKVYHRDKQVHYLSKHNSHGTQFYVDQNKFQLQHRDQ